MPDQIKSQPPRGDGDNIIIYNNCTFINGTGNQDNSVRQAIHENTSQSNVPQRRWTQWAHGALVLAKCLTAVLGFIG